MLVAAAAVMAKGWPTLFAPAALATLSAAALLGLAPYAALPLRARAVPPPLDTWGDQRSVQGFLTHFLRKEYGTFQLASVHEAGEAFDTAKAARRLALFAQRFSAESLALGPPLAACGAAVLLWRRPQRGGPFVAMLAAYSVAINVLANLSFSELHVNILARMWQQAFVLGYVLAGVGFHFVATAAVARAAPTAAARAGLRRSLVPAVAAALVARQCAAHWAVSDMSGNRVFQRYGVDALRNRGGSSILLVNDDTNCNVIAYTLRCAPPANSTDLWLIRLPVMTYEWWKPMQLSRYPGLGFPGAKHHPCVEC